MLPKLFYFRKIPGYLLLLRAQHAGIVSEKRLPPLLLWAVALSIENHSSGLARGALAHMRVEMALAQPHDLRGHLDQLVIINIGDSLFQAEAFGRGEDDGLVLAGGPDIGELLALQRIDLEIVAAGVSPMIMPL